MPSRFLIARAIGASILVGIAFAGICVSPVVAQTSAATIVGQVTDESHAVLPGVTVTATSPALQVPAVVSVTDANGEYRLTALPIGTYVVKYELAGFQSVEHQDIRLTTGFVAKIDTAMKVGRLEESLTVTGQSPIVDITTASTPTTLVREALEELPTTRNSLVSLATQTPGIRTSASGFDVGGSLFTGGTSLNNFGRSGDNWLMLDGILTTAAAGSTEGVYWDFSTYEEAVVQTAGGNAEVPSSGVYLNTILKSGGNTFHGSGYYAVTGPWAQSDNIDAALQAKGVAGTNKINERYDVSGDLGGRIVRDKLWFYGNFRRAYDDVNVINVFKPDGSPGNFPKLQRFWTTKLSYQLSPTQRLVALEQWNGKYNVRSTINTGWESRVIQNQTGNTRKLEWNGTFGGSFTASGMFGYWNYDSPLTGGSYGKVASYDIGLLRYGGDEFYLAGPAPVDVTQHRYQTKLNTSWFKRDLIGGNHEFRAGFDYTPGTYHNIYHPRGASQDYYLIFRNGAPFEIGTWNIPVEPMTRADYAGAFLQDNWTLGELTLNVGLRYDRNTGYNPEQSREAGTFAAAQTFARVDYPTWNAVAPRVHAAWDVTGRARTVLKGGWSRYDKMRFVGEVTPSNLNWLTTNVYLWHDLNTNRLYEPGEVNLDLNGSDFVSSENPPGITALPNGGGTGIPNPGEREPKIDELTVNLEHQVASNFALRFSGVYTREFNLRRLAGVNRPYSSYNIPISRLDPGPDGVTGNADDTGRLLTYHEYPTALRGKANAVTMPVNDPDFVNLNRAIEVSAVKRSSNNWQMLGAIGQIWPDKAFASDLAPLTPNAEIFSRDQARRWYVKLGGSYRFQRIDVLTSANFNATSGEPFTRTVLVSGGTTIPSLAVPAERFGSQHYPHAYLLDVRAEKSVRFRGHRASARVDLFNALNSNVVISQTIQSGVNYLRPTTIIPSRIGVFSVSYTF